MSFLTISDVDKTVDDLMAKKAIILERGWGRTIFAEEYNRQVRIDMKQIEYACVCFFCFLIFTCFFIIPFIMSFFEKKEERKSWYYIFSFIVDALSLWGIVISVYVLVNIDPLLIE